MATTRIDTVQLIGDMEKVAAQLTQLVADMKGSAAQVLAGKAFVSDLPEIDESAKIEKFKIAQPDMRTKSLSGIVGLESILLRPKSVITSVTASLDAAKLIADIKNVASEILKKRIEEVAGFSERQAKAIAIQAEAVAEGIATGKITEETREFFLKGLRDMVENFIRTLEKIKNVVIEQIVNAVFEVLRKAIEAAIPVL
ncbi:hypothetical protein [Candidatus Electronema sp. JC]|uniref:hypothetical protein n=1 Tax=Candidatus Electronema sp. JC TaxID=3401570 RepID=UPI003B429475